MVDEAGAAVGTGETFDIAAQLIVRSVGYRGTPIDDVPFDSRRNVIPNDEGRVLPDAGVPIKGLYVAGWIKRGPSGIIGTNKKDAAATVASLLLDLADEPVKGANGIIDLLAAKGIEPIGFDGWKRIDAAEQALGATRGRERTTLHSIEGLNAAAKS
jgi:ferredoxin--NADP+ reductase